MDGFHIKPETYAIFTAAENGFHVAPEVYAILPNENEFHVHLEAFAFELLIGQKRPVLRLIISYNGKNMILYFTMTATAPAVAIRWNGVNWYNPLVSPSSYKASNVLITYKGQTLAFST